MSALRRFAWPVAVAVLLIAVSVGLLLAQRGEGGALDPRANSASGGKALAQLLRQHGTAVRLVTDDADALAAARPGTTVLVAAPDRLRSKALESLHASGARLVLVAPDDVALTQAELPLEVAVEAAVEPRDPACTDPLALRAGAVDAGGHGYRGSESSGIGCYAVAGAATYVSLDGGRVVVLGSAAMLVNAALDRQGNAALALLLLGQGEEVLWLLPPAPPLSAAEQGASLRSLLPRQVKAAALALGLAVVVLALARARRLGRVVQEPLPVVVRSAETVEGTALLYRAAHARDSAAEALRAATRDRLRRRLSVPSGHRPEALVDAVTARAAREPAQVGALLYGLAPSDDSALVALADALDALDQEVLRP